MDDNERRFIRLGHYLGWIHAIHEALTELSADET
jgi:hypothetical protein